MKLLVLRISDKTYYSHHLSKEPGYIWFKEFKACKFISLPLEVEKLRIGDELIYNGTSGYLLCEAKPCFMTWLRLEEGKPLDNLDTAINEVIRANSIDGINYKIKTGPIIRSINQSPFTIPMLNIA